MSANLRCDGARLRPPPLGLLGPMNYQQSIWEQLPEDLHPPD